MATRLMLVTVLLISLSLTGTADSASFSPQVDVVNADDFHLKLIFKTPPAELIPLSDQQGATHALSYEGESWCGSQDMPQLPAVGRFVLVPAGHRAELSASVGEASVSQIPAELISSLAIGAAGASGVKMFPPEPAVLGAAQGFRGYRLQPLTIHPYQFEPSTGRLYHHERVEVSISFVPDVEAEPTEPRTLTRDTYEFLRAIVLNPPHRDDAGDRLPRGGYMIFYPSNGVGNNGMAEINRLAEWKRAYGHRVEIVAPNRHNGNGNNIRNIILAAYREWDPPVEYVCLAGGFAQVPPPSGQAADILHGLLDNGNDVVSEVAIGRIHAVSDDQYVTQIRRAINYQYTPYIENRGWFNIAGSLIDMVRGYDDAVLYTGRWVTAAERRAGFTDVREFVTGVNQGDPAQTLNNWISDRMNIVFVRGNRVSYSFPNLAINPVYISSGGGHSERQWQGIWNSGSPNQPTGPSVVTGTWHNPDTRSCDILLAGMARGAIVDKTSVGWSRALAMTMLSIGAGGNFNYFTNWFTLFGEPGQKIWCGPPGRIIARHPGSISPGMNMMNLQVADAGADVDLADAFISLLHNGQLVAEGFTNADGSCALAIPPDLDGSAVLTISKDNFLPYRATLQVRRNRVFVSAYIREILEEENNDDEVNPGERVSLRVTAHNYGSAEIARRVRGVVTSVSPWITVVNGELEFGDIDPDEEVNSNQPLVIEVAPSARGGIDPELTIELSSDDNAPSFARLPLQLVGAQLGFNSVVGNRIISDGLTNLDVIIQNDGTMPSPEMTVELISRSWAIQALRSISTIPAIAPNRTSRLNGDRFQIIANRIAIPGTIVPMTLLVTAQEGDAPDTLRFELQVGEPRVNAPQGPDSYGYVCYDDTDDGWEFAPDYDWIEINPRDQNRDLDGRALPGQRQSNFAAEVRLPFPFRFYGQMFERATVSENGFLALGQGLEELRNYENFPLDNNMGGSFGMIAPMWDDLNFSSGDNTNIYTAHDEEFHLFIVEWVNGRIMNGQPSLTFQVILYDPEFYPTDTGDGMIKIQYRSVLQGNQVPRSFSAGICSPDGRTGLGYVFNNLYNVAARPIENQRAMLYTTQNVFSAGVIQGQVTDYATGLPLQATIHTNYGQVAFANAEGLYKIERAWATTFDINARMQGYNDSTLERQSLEVGDTLTINFALLHPEFVASTSRISVRLDNDVSYDVPLNITNSGNGPLDWRLERNLIGEANAEPWTHRREMAVGAAVGDDRMEGVAFVNQRFYVSGANGGDPLIYVFDREGALLDSFPQPRRSNRGIRDLGWDGELLWGGVDNTVYGFTTEGEVRHQFAVNVNPVNCLTFDSENGWLWISGVTTDIFAYTRDGQRVGDVTLPRNNLRFYGLAYWEDDPDEHNLYALHKDREDGLAKVRKFNTQTRAYQDVSTLFPEPDRSPCGAFISREWDVYSWVFFWVSSSSIQGGGDRVEAHQIAARKDWFILNRDDGQNRREVNAGRIEQGETDHLTLTFSTLSMPDTQFVGELLFLHNADSGRMHVEVLLDVIGPRQPLPFQLSEPGNWDSLETTDVVFAWTPSVDLNDNDRVSYTAYLTNSIDTLSFALLDTTFTVNLDTLFGRNMDHARQFEWWVVAHSPPHAVECDQRFHFVFAPNSAPGRGPALPEVFAVTAVHPNPFNERVTIKYGLPGDAEVKLALFDIAGRQVAVVDQGRLKAGWHQLSWRAGGLPSGVYLARLQAGREARLVKLTLIK